MPASIVHREPKQTVIQRKRKSDRLPGRDATYIIYLTLITIPECPHSGKGLPVVGTAYLNVLNRAHLGMLVYLTALSWPPRLAAVVTTNIPWGMWVIEKRRH